MMKFLAYPVYTLLVILVMISSCSLFQKDEINMYVSTEGDDRWTGRLSTANEDRTDGPFATLERAVEEIKSICESDVKEDFHVIVNVRGGRYFIENGLKLENVGANCDNQITLRALHGEDVRLTGGVEIGAMSDVENPAIWNQLNAKARDHVRQVDLRALGITDYGRIAQRGSPGMQLFFGDSKMDLARYPNEGWLRIADVPQHGVKRYHDGLEREKRFNNVPVGRHYGKITCDDDRPAGWSAQNDIYVHGYWTWDWSDSYQKVRKIDKSGHEITLQEPHHRYGYTTNQRFYFLNILEELDSPGEWYLDRKQGALYWWPPEDQVDEACVSTLEDPFLEMTNCSHVSIEGFTFEMSRSNGVVIDGGKENTIAGCTFRFLGDDALVINGGKNNGVLSSDFHDLALGAIVLRGGERKTLTPAGNFAVNNHIHHYGQWLRTWMLAVSVNGVGNRVAHNLIHDAPHEAIYVRGNEHVLEYNDIHSICKETGDAGAIHTGRNYTWRGNIYRYNYIHDIKGPGLHGVAAIYLDDFTSGYTIYGNICCNAGRGTLIGGGRDNVVENNIYIECTPSIVLDARGLSWASYYFDGTYTVLEDSMSAMNATEPPFSEKYSELLSLYEDEPPVPKNNVIRKNISYNGRWIELYDYFMYDHSVVTMEDNVIADDIICKRMGKDPGEWEPYYLNLDGDVGYVFYKYGDEEIMEEFSKNLIIDTNPGFLDAEKRDFRLRNDAAAHDVGFKPIPFDKIGLYKDKYRNDAVRSFKTK